MQTIKFDAHEPAPEDNPDPVDEPVDDTAEDAEVADDEVMAEEEDTGVSTDGILAYGIVAEVLTILPLVLILIGAGDSLYGKYHAKMMEYTVGAWAPFAILFWIQFAEDNEWVRMAMTGALITANGGAWSGMWVGWYAFLVKAQGAGTLGMGMNALFAILYPCINIGLIVMQWFMGKEVLQWINEAPHGDLGGSGEDAGDDMEDAADDMMDEADALGRFW